MKRTAKTNITDAYAVLLNTVRLFILQQVTTTETVTASATDVAVLSTAKVTKAVREHVHVCAIRLALWASSIRSLASSGSCSRRIPPALAVIHTIDIQ